MQERVINAGHLQLDAHLVVLSLTADLFTIFARDESEKANLEAVNAIGAAFNATAAALFYISSEKKYRVCISGTDYPITLNEERWKACVMPNDVATMVSRLGPWSLPGIGITLPSWIAVCLYTSGNEGGYVFLGRASGEWKDLEVSSLASLKKALEPVVKIRHERGIEMLRKEEAERLLARNEARLRDLFEGSRDMIYTATEGDMVTSVNKAGQSLLGYRSKSDILGRPFSEFVNNPDDRILFLQRLAKDGYVDDYEIVLQKKDGSSIFCLETAHAIKDEKGSILEIQGSVKDISGRIENERKLWRMNLELAEANLKLQKTQALMVQHEKLASIGQLAAGVAHEINNPLGFLISNDAMLHKYYKKLKAAWPVIGATAASEAAKRDVENAFTNAEAIFSESKEGFDRIVKIVSSLKNFSRIDQGGDFENFDLNAGIESTIVVAWNEIKYVSELRKKLGDIPHIRANGSQINQVILNLLVNAAQAMSGTEREGKGSIEIATKLDDDHVLLSIQDDGPGIPKPIVNRIFDPFFTTKEPGKGTGLGLSISYDIIVHKHGGSIWVDSEQGVGTTFFISLPVDGPPPQEPDQTG